MIICGHVAANNSYNVMVNLGFFAIVFLFEKNNLMKSYCSLSEESALAVVVRYDLRALGCDNVVGRNHFAVAESGYQKANPVVFWKGQ